MQEGRKAGRFLAGTSANSFLVSCFPKIEPWMLASVHAPAPELPDQPNTSFGSGRRPGWDVRRVSCSVLILDAFASGLIIAWQQFAAINAYCGNRRIAV